MSPECTQRYYQDLKNSIEDIVEYKLIKEVHEIAELGNFQVTEHSVNYIIEFYQNVDSKRFKQIKRAPKDVQKNYLRVVEENYSTDHLDQLIDLNEILDYSIKDIPEYKMTEYGIFKEAVYNSELTAIDKFCRNYLERNLSIKYGENYPKDPINQMLVDIDRSFNDNQVRPILVTAIYVLINKYTKEVIDEILERFLNEDEMSLDILSLHYLANNWKELSNYPLTWSLETLN